MWQRTLLPALLIIGLLTTIGVASASISGDSATSTTIGAITSTTTGDSTTSTTIDDHNDDDSTTSTTMAGAVWIPDGLHVIQVRDAGSVTVRVTSGALSIVSVDIDGQWTRTDTEQSAREVSIEFRNGSSELEVKAEIEGGQLKTRVRFEHDEDDESGDS